MGKILPGRTKKIIPLSYVWKLEKKLSLEEVRDSIFHKFVYSVYDLLT